MAITLLCLVANALSAGLTTEYTAPAGTKVVIRSASFCNSTAGVVALSVKINPRTAGTDRTVVSLRNIAVGETYTCPELVNQVLEPGGLIRALGLNIECVIGGAQVVEHA